MDTSAPNDLVWHFVSAGLAALSTFVDGLVMFVLVGFRNDIRDLRKTLDAQSADVSSLRQQVGQLQGQAVYRTPHNDD